VSGRRGENGISRWAPHHLHHILERRPCRQNVNKVSTRITLWFGVANSPSLTDEDKEPIMSRLGSRISKDGALRVVSQSTRSQLSNRESAIERFVELLCAALTFVSVRREMRLSRTAKLRRLEKKKERGILKHGRSKAPIED
jgi:ribosome-associated protein